METVKIGILLNRIKESVNLENTITYKRVTVKGKNQGVTLRDIEQGVNIGTKKQFVIHEGQFLLSKIDARNGAFGIVSKTLDGAIITGNFWTFEVNKELLNIDWFNIFVSSPYFIKICSKASSGTTNRQYLNEQKFLNFEIQLPNLQEQALFIKRYNAINEKFIKINNELEIQRKIAQKLTNSILLDAIQGKLVKQDEKDEPTNILLNKIKHEKEKLINDNKIKRDKPLPDITKEEMNFTLPDSWEWSRLNDVVIKITDGTHQTPNYTESGRVFLSAQNIKPFKFMPDTHRYVSEEDYQNYIKNIKPEKGDILLTRVGSNIGESAVINQKIDFAIYVSLCLIKNFSELIDPNYICLWLNSPEGTKKSLDNILGRGTSQGNLNLTLIRNFLIPVPPFNEQKRIVEKVKKLMILSDELLGNIETTKKQNEKLLNGVILEAFTH